MATWFNKWLLFSLFPVLTLSWNQVGENQGTGNVIAPHPLHVSVVELNHNNTAKTFEISVRIFTDDFETVLKQNYKTKVDLINPVDKSAMEKLVNDYIYKRLRIEADGKPVTLNFLGFEKDNDAIYSYFEAENIPAVKKIHIQNALMHDLFTDQINLMHITVGGNRKSTKLNFPDKDGIFQF